MKKNRFSKKWLNEHLHDPYVKQAQKDNYRSRAAYKLQEIDQDHRLVRPGQLIVELGSAPGAWSQYLVRRMGSDAAGAVTSRRGCTRRCASRSTRSSANWKRGSRPPSTSSR